MSTEEHKALIVRVINELKKGNLGIVDEVFSPHFAFHWPNDPDFPRGLEGARKMVTLSAATVPDMQATIEDIIGEGDKVAVRWTFRGTYQGEAKPGYPRPGERFSVVAISMYRFANGKIEDDWGVEQFWPREPPWE